MNVSLPRIQEQFVRNQVAAGVYRSASEVVRDGLRLLQDASHRRLLERSLYEEVSESELGSLPATIRNRVRRRFKALIDEALDDVEKGRLVDGAAAMNGMKKRLVARQTRKSA